MELVLSIVVQTGEDSVAVHEAGGMAPHASTAWTWEFGKCWKFRQLYNIVQDVTTASFMQTPDPKLQSSILAATIHVSSGGILCPWQPKILLTTIAPQSA